MFKIYLLDSRNYPAVLYDDLHIFDPAVLEPELEMNGDNGILIGKLTFKLRDPSLSPQLRLLQNTVIVTQMIGGVEIVTFRGRPLLRDDDDYNDQDFTFEGILSGLNDTLQTPSTDKGIGFTSHLAIILNRHNYLASSYSYGNKNRMVDYSKIDRHFESSYMHTIEGDPFSESLAYKANIDPVSLDYVRTRASTMDHLKTQFIDSWGGYFYLENEPLTYDSDGCIVLHNYLNYVDIHSPKQAHMNTQRIEFGKNLISIKRSVSADDFATVFVPLGKQLTDVDKAWPYYQSVDNNKVLKIDRSPDDGVAENYSSVGAYIDPETGKEKSGVSSSYVLPADVNVEPGDVFYLTTYLEGISTDTSIASYAVISRDGQKAYSIGPTIRNSKDSNNNVTIGKLTLKDERIEIPTPEDTSVLLKLRLAYMISANDPNGGFVLKKFNPQYQEDNVTIMSVSPVTTGTIRKRGQFDIGRDVFPDATENAESPELYEQSKRVYNNDLYEIFGSIEKVIEFSDYGIDNLSTIYSKAAMDLEKMGEDLEIEIQAADLSYIDESQEPFQPYDLVPVYSEPHNIDMMLPIVKMTLPLADPAAATYTLQNDIHLSEDSKKYISQMVSSPGANAQKNQTVVIYNGGGSSGGGGSQGPAGYSPTVAVTAITGGHTVIITDENGDHAFNVMDGEDGQDGADGVSPAVTVTPIEGGNRITITDKTHPSGISFDVMDGEDGSSSDLKHTATIQKYNGFWRLLSDGTTMTWEDLWNNHVDDITLIVVDGTITRQLHKTSVEFVNSGTPNSVDIYFSDQRYNDRTAEGNAYRLTVPSDGSTGTITEITGSDIPTSGGSGSTPYEIPITYTNMWITTRSSDEIYAHADNCVLNVDGTILEVLSAEKYVEDGDQFVRIVAVDYTSFDSTTCEFTAWEIIAQNSDVYTPIISKYEYDTKDLIHHKIFFYNESTGAITKAEGGAATGSDISGLLISGYSVYIVGFELKDGDLSYFYYEPMEDTIIGGSNGSVRFYRPTDAGTEVLTIASGSSNATKSMITANEFAVFFGINPNSQTVSIVNGNNVQVTGQTIKDWVINTNAGCVLVVTDNEDANHFLIYDLDEYTSTGAVVFYRIADGYRHTITVPTNSNVGTKAKEPLVDSEGGDPAQIDAVLYTTQNLTDSQKRVARRNIGLNGYAIGLYHKLYSGSTTSGALYAIQADGTVSSTPLTFSDIWKTYYNNDKCFIFAYDENNNVYKLKHIGDDTIVLHYVDGDTEHRITMSLVSGETPSTSQTVSANKSSVSSGSATNEIYYVDGTTMKSDDDNAARTGQQILNETIANGITPIVRVYNSTAQEDEIFHYYVSHSGGIEFLTLDGTKKLTINWSSSTVTITEVSISGDPFMIYAVWDSSQDKYVLKKSSSLSGENVTFSELFSNRFNLWLNRSLHVNGIFYSDGYNEYRFSQDEIDNTGSTVTTVEWIIHAGSSTGVTVDRLTHTSGDDSSNVYYYIDGTNIKNAKTNLAVTGQDIYDQTIAQGLAPVLYESSTGYFETIQYHFYRYGSFGMYFRRLDGAFEVSIHWSNLTFIKTEGGYNTPFQISAVWNSSQNKYILRALVDGSWVTASFNDIYNHAEGLLLNSSLFVDKVYKSPPSWISVYFYDIQPTSSGLSIIEWHIEADSSNTITVTRTIAQNIQRTTYYAVTLNADGTVNTKDSSLSWSTVSGRMSNPAFADYLLITWGSTLFTAKAVEKAANGDIKFICDVEHDGIQRHMVFTLDGDNILATTAIETYSLRPVTVWEVQDATQGLSALNTNITANLAWQLTNLDLTPFKRIKIYSRAGRKTGAAAADSSITPASIIEMSLDDRAKETVSQNVFIGSSVVQNPNDANRLGLLTCAVSADKTKFAVVRATTLYGTAATSNTDAHPNVFMIEGYYD